MKVVVAVALLLCAHCIDASLASADDKLRARSDYATATRHYDLSEYEAALDGFREAYRNFDDPAFLFNIAQCHRQLGHPSEAIRFYRTYLLKVPNASNAAEVRRLIAALQSAPADMPQPTKSASLSSTTEPGVRPTSPSHASESATALAATPPGARVPSVGSVTTSAPLPSATKRTPAWRRPWIWIVVGVGAAGLATGLAVGLTQSRSTEPTLNGVTVP